MSVTTEAYTSVPQGMIPNSRFPLLVQRNAIPGGGADKVKEHFRRNGWSNNWDYRAFTNTPIFTRRLMSALAARTAGWRSACR